LIATTLPDLGEQGALSVGFWLKLETFRKGCPFIYDASLKSSVKLLASRWKSVIFTAKNYPEPCSTD
jgi:hypothetical protein